MGSFDSAVVPVAVKQRHLELLVAAGIFLAYSVTTSVALDAGPTRSLLGGAANAIPIALFGAGVHSIIARVGSRSLYFQLAVHALLCTVFCAASYGLLIVLLGLFKGPGPGGFDFSPFPVSGAAWQSLQNVTFYALIAALSYLQATSSRRHAVHDSHAVHPSTGNLDSPGIVPGQYEGEREMLCAQVPRVHRSRNAEVSVESGPDAGSTRYFVKIGDELRPLDLDAVVCIRGADDYAEVCTATRKHLVRMTLSALEKSLDPHKFIRVHRSLIVNTHRVVRAEPAGGGRLLLHMETNQTISTSRSGARLFRNRIL